MTAILGISAFYHDSAAALVVDGEIVAAAQEERFTRKKHDDGFPACAIEYCLSQGGLKPPDLNYVGYYEKPLLKSSAYWRPIWAMRPRAFGLLSRRCQSGSSRSSTCQAKSGADCGIR